MSFVLIAASALLAHSGYSSYEFHHFIKTTSSKNTINSVPLPNDIVLELIASIALFLVHLFLFNTTSRKLSLVDSGREVKSEGKLKNIWMNEATTEDEIRGSSGFRAVENRVHYIDIANLRENFQQWKSEEGLKDDDNKEAKELKDVQGPEEKKDEK